MKTTTQQHNVYTSEDVQEKKFSIAGTAMAFEILSSKIYTDPHLAIVRELSTNAYDSHRQAGNTEQFIVHLPNILQPHFSIRDYGTGLTKAQIENIYTTYFASTRSNSNEYVGALGLGSKSPFAYTNQFVVISYKDGYCYKYSAFRNKNGEPAIAILSETTTEEPNGLEIIVNVKQEDFNKFYVAAQKVYTWFNDKPIINGHIINLEKPASLEWLIDRSVDSQDDLNIEIYDIDKYSAQNSCIKVLMGEILYGIDSGSLKISKLQLDSSMIVIRANIGDVDISANREELYLSEKTINYVNGKVRNLEDAILSKFFKQFKSLDKTFDKFVLVKNTKRIYNFEDISLVEDGFNYHDYYIRLEEIGVRAWCFHMASPNGRMRKDKILYVDGIDYNKPCSIIVVGENDAIDSRKIKYFMQQNKKTSCEVLVVEDIIKFNKFGYVQGQKISEIKLPKIPKASKQQTYQSKAYLIVSSHGTSDPDNSSTIDPNNCFIVERDNSTLMCDTYSCESHCSQSLWAIANLIKPNVSLIAVTAAKMKKFPHIKRLDTAILEFDINLSKEMKAYIYRKYHMESKNVIDDILMELIKDCKSETASEAFNAMSITMCSDLSKLPHQLERTAYVEILRIKDLFMTLDFSEFIDPIQKFYEKYPLLCGVSRNISKDEVINYINFKDNQFS